jgi:hypothetical protein
MLETKLDLPITLREDDDSVAAFQFANGISPNSTRNLFPFPERLDLGIIARIPCEGFLAMPASTVYVYVVLYV